MAKDKETLQPESSYPQTPLLYDLNDTLSWVRFLSERRITGVLSKSPVVPVTLIGSIDSGETFHPGSVGLNARSVPDLDTTSQDYHLMMSHARNLGVHVSDYLDWVPQGRTLIFDKGGATNSWTTNAGTVSYNTTRPYPGCAANLNLTTAASNNAQAQALIKLQRLADGQNRVNGPKIWFSGLFRMNDVNTAFVQLSIDLQDAANEQRLQFRFLTPSGQPQVLDSAGNVVNINTGASSGFSNGSSVYVTSTNPVWHFIGMEVMWQSGLQVPQYVRLRLDDFVWDATPYCPARIIGAATVNETQVDILAQTAAAGNVATSVDFAAIQLKDLVNVRAVLG